jgi:hypothetical protein
MCLIASGLLLHSFLNLLHVDRGFEIERIVTVDLSLPDNRYPNLEKRTAFLHSLLERVRALPGVASAGVSNRLPLAGEGGNNLINVEGRNIPVMERPLADIRQVNPDYFRTMGIPLRSGRIFDETDRSRRLALVSAKTAESLWPGQNVIGKRFRVGGGDDSPLIEVAGIVGDVRSVSLNKGPSLTVYLPYWQRFYSQASNGNPPNGSGYAGAGVPNHAKHRDGVSGRAPVSDEIGLTLRGDCDTTGDPGNLWRRLVFGGAKDQ